jgi:hypothetical protein
MTMSRSSNRCVKHGMFGTRTYRAWVSMKSRCLNKKHRQYVDYGGRGITVCEAWRLSFDAFFADMGEAPEGLTLDREDNERGYEPNNCRWVTQQLQILNRRTLKKTKRVEGVFYDVKKARFRAHIMRNHVRHDLGSTPDFFEACCRRKSAEARLQCTL